MSVPQSRRCGASPDHSSTITVCHDCRVEQRVSLVTLGVSDLVRSRGFYEDLVWSDAQQPDDEVCFFQAGGMVFGLWTALGGHGAPRIELAYNVRSPEEVTEVLNEAVDAGGSISWASLEELRPRAPGVSIPNWSVPVSHANRLTGQYL